jgi:hypothetical protein
MQALPRLGVHGLAWNTRTVIQKVRVLRMSVPGLDEVPNHEIRGEIEELERQLDQLPRDDQGAIVARLELLRTALEPDYYNSYHDHACYVLDIPTVVRHSVLVPLDEVPAFAEPCGHCSPPRPTGIPRSATRGPVSREGNSAATDIDADVGGPVVGVGATVHVCEQGAGKTYSWTIVSSASDPKSAKISADTAVAKALLGHRVGDVVSVAAGTVRRYTIEGIDPAPPKPAPAPSAARATQRPVAISADTALFGPGQDAEYEEWVRRNSGGYVLKQRDSVDEGYMLHLADCTHLGLTPGTFTMRTGNPRRCSRSRAALVHWCLAETGAQPHKCSSCL